MTATTMMNRISVSACVASLLLVATAGADSGHFKNPRNVTETGKPGASATGVGNGKVGKLLTTIKAVGKQGKGNVAAQKAYRELITLDASVLPAILNAFHGANPLAVNWLRNAFESIADRTLNSGDTLPVDELERFIQNTEQHPRARRLAFEWLRTVEPKRAEKLVPGFLLDPSAALRREAVQRLIDKSEQLDPETEKQQLVTVLRTALRGAVHDDQVKDIVRPLRKLGEEVDLQKHFGFLTEWQIIGPFDNRDKKGFDVAYPPEKGIDLDAVYKGQLGKVRWQTISTDDPYGIIDIAKSLKNYKGSAMYLYTEFDSPTERDVEFRLGTPNAWKLWLNGEQLFAREEYHRGMKLDQYAVRGRLQPGRNGILLKILQNEQTEDWAQRYRFQLRVCDGAGSAVLPQKPTAGEKTRDPKSE